MVCRESHYVVLGHAARRRRLRRGREGLTKRACTCAARRIDAALPPPLQVGHERPRRNGSPCGQAVAQQRSNQPPPREQHLLRDGPHGPVLREALQRRAAHDAAAVRGVCEDGALERLARPRGGEREEAADLARLDALAEGGAHAGLHLAQSRLVRLDHAHAAHLRLEAEVARLGPRLTHGLRHAARRLGLRRRDACPQGHHQAHRPARPERVRLAQCEQRGIVGHHAAVDEQVVVDPRGREDGGGRGGGLHRLPQLRVTRAWQAWALAAGALAAAPAAWLRLLCGARVGA
eukprot:scaffold24263_cov69-Phaeocystis_antarctica.AAC.8